ncbi:hypothetical protein [Paenibacillus alkalitolerans]|uniref:hypothetical protein n=1 Tax=Paenibacillus alkalitolerans TaxID=2799335 RepID=UPI0018F36EE1|nr:hypothetical protein [Paenibacillus alkalitolerans]
MQDNRVGVIENLPLLDLTSLKTPEELTSLRKISNVALILVPESLHSKLLQISIENVASIVSVPEGENVIICGETKMSGESLANAGGKDSLVIVGQLTITSAVQQVTYKRIIVIGQLLAPRGSEPALAPAITRCDGQLVYYGANLRFFTGSDHFTKDFFELLDEPIFWVLCGMFTIDDDVTPELLKSKVSEIVLAGTLKAPKSLTGILQVKATEKAGKIIPLKDDKINVAL